MTGGSDLDLGYGVGMPWDLGVTGRIVLSYWKLGWLASLKELHKIGQSYSIASPSTARCRA